MALSRALNLCRSFSTVSSEPLRVCIVGSGPAGFYTVDKILKAHEGAEVDIVDLLPTPFGLVRSGVAPDHPETKVAQNRHCSFIGNVSLGASIFLAELHELYDSVVLSYGAESDQALGIPGEELSWLGYMLPENLFGGINLAPDLKSSDTAFIIGQEELKNNRIKRRLHELLSRAATPATSVCNPGQRELHFVFFRKPDRFLESDDQSGRVAGLCKEKTILKEDVGSGKQIAVGTGLFEEMECGLILKSVGYKSVPVDGLPFDHHKGIVPNVGGRVLSEASGDAEVEKGLYVCGWLKRGPTGIVATNLYCAEETVSSFSEDVKRGVVRSRSGLSKHGREGLLQLLDSRNVKIVPFGGWEKIDSEEKRRGGLKNKRREKLTTWQELLEVATK
ncbi:unnamed protein product [Withania somnifera]